MILYREARTMSLMETATPFNLLTVKQTQNFGLKRKLGPHNQNFILRDQLQFDLKSTHFSHENKTTLI